MKKNEITLCDKQVGLAYCYATEIAFKTLSDTDIIDFMQEVSEALNSMPQRMPDMQKTIYLIIAAISAYYEGDMEKSPIKDTDLMYRAEPLEIGTALGIILSLRAEFYHLPAGESEEKKDGAKPKKRKNA